MSNLRAGAVTVKPNANPRPRLVLQPASRRSTRHTSTNALKRFFAIADEWELSPLQQCRLLKIPSPQVLDRYRLGQAPRLSATQQERVALLASIQGSLRVDVPGNDRAWAWVHGPRKALPFAGDSPLYFMLENGLPALREVARMLVRPDLCTLRHIIHGGAVMAFADSVGAAATVINLPEDAKGTTTIESKTNFIGGAKEGSTVIATATPVHRGRRTQVWQTRLETEDGKLVAIVTQTQMVL